MSIRIIQRVFNTFLIRKFDYCICILKESRIFYKIKTKQNLEKSIFFFTWAGSMTILLIEPNCAKCSSSCFTNVSGFRLLTNKLLWADFWRSSLIVSSFLCFLPSKCCLNWSSCQFEKEDLIRVSIKRTVILTIYRF